MQKRQTIHIPTTHHQRTFTYTSTAQLNGLVTQWIDQLIDKGQLSEDKQYTPKAVIIGGNKRI